MVLAIRYCASRLSSVTSPANVVDASFKSSPPRLQSPLFSLSLPPPSRSALLMHQSHPPRLSSGCRDRPRGLVAPPSISPYLHISISPYLHISIAPFVAPSPSRSLAPSRSPPLPPRASFAAAVHRPRGLELAISTMRKGERTATGGFFYLIWGPLIAATSAHADPHTPCGNMPFLSNVFGFRLFDVTCYKVLIYGHWPSYPPPARCPPISDH